VNLARGAACALWEVTCLGLPARGECFGRGSFRQRYRVMREGLPVFVDGFVVNDDNRGRMAGAGALREEPVHGLFLAGPFRGPTCEEECECLRDAVDERLQGQVSITRLGEFYLGRYLGGSAEHARAQFARWWQLLRPRLLGRPACPPRIWLT